MVKIVLTGATGFVGKHVLEYCITHTQITKIVVITRTALPASYANNPKVEVIIHKSFEDCPGELLNRLDGAVACLWCLGLKGQPISYPDLREAEIIDVAYPVAAAKAFQRTLGKSTKLPFRFVLLSGSGAEFDQTKSFWMLHQTKLLKGRAEAAVFDVGKETGLEVYTCRPFLILEKNAPWAKQVFSYLIDSIAVDELSASMLDLGLNGNAQVVWENDELVKHGHNLLL